MLNCFGRRNADDDEDEDEDDDLELCNDEDADENDEDCDEEGCEVDPEELALWDEAGATGNPKDYYFKVAHDPNHHCPTMITITPKKYFDAEGYLWDQHISLECGGPLDIEYAEIAEGIFEPLDEGDTVASIEADLRSRGFIHNPNLPC